MNLNWNYKCAQEKHKGKNIEFYQLEEFYNKKLMLSHVIRHLKNKGVPDICEILNVWYIPLKKFQVLYRLNSEKDMSLDVIMLIRFYNKGKSIKKYQKAMFVANDKDSVLHLSSWDAVAWIFPEDSKLPSLRIMFDKRNISRFMSQYIGFIPDVKQIDWKLLSYLPGNRCSVLYKIPQLDYSIIGKIQNPALVVESHANLINLWETPERGFRMSCPIGLDEKLGVHWEYFVEGKSIEESFSEIQFNHFVKDMTNNLVSLHKLHIENLTANGFIRHVIHQLDSKTMPRIREALPFLRSEIDEYYKLLLQQADSIPESVPVTIHGDLHPANMLIAKKGIIFIDMDSLAIGDPVYDLAYFASRLFLMSLYRRERLREVAEAISDLPDAYEDAGGVRISKRSFAWYISAFLFGREIKSCILHRAPELEQLTAELLEYAHKTLMRERFEASIVRS